MGYKKFTKSFLYICEMQILQRSKKVQNRKDQYRMRENEIEHDRTRLQKVVDIFEKCRSCKALEKPRIYQYEQDRKDRMGQNRIEQDLMKNKIFVIEQDEKGKKGKGKNVRKRTKKGIELYRKV